MTATEAANTNINSIDIISPMKPDSRENASEKLEPGNTEPMSMEPTTNTEQNTQEPSALATPDDNHESPSGENQGAGDEA